jgi:hypothetical protein
MCKTICIVFITTLVLGACVPQPRLVSESKDLKKDWYLEKGYKAKCTDTYSINVDKLESVEDFYQIIALMEIKDGWARLYYRSDNTYDMEGWKCPNSEVEVKGYLKNVKTKYPQAIINND